MSDINNLYLYLDNIDLFETKLKEFKAKKSFLTDIKIYKELLADDKAELLKIVTYTKILSSVVVKDKEFRLFNILAMDYLNRKTTCSLQSCMVNINIIKILSSGKWFNSVIYNCLMMIRQFYKLKTKSNNKKYDCDDLKVTSDDVKSVELQIYVINTSLELLRKNIFRYKNNVAFPELGKMVVKELNKLCDGEFKDIFKEISKEINETVIEMEENRKNWFKKEETISIEEAQKYEKALLKEDE